MSKTSAHGIFILVEEMRQISLHIMSGIISTLSEMAGSTPNILWPGFGQAVLLKASWARGQTVVLPCGLLGSKLLLGSRTWQEVCNKGSSGHTGQLTQSPKRREMQF